MKAIVYQGPEQVATVDVAYPAVVPDGWTRIKVSHAGICGSDVTIVAGKHPRAKAPLVLGHEFSGYIDSPNPDFAEGELVVVFPYLACGECERCRNGQFHVCSSLKLIGIDMDGGMAEYVLVPNTHIYKAPAGIDPALAAFIEPIGISVHSARKGGYRPGCSVVVFGAGAIGLSTAITLRHFGADHLIICEPNPARQELARELGFDVLDSSKPIVEQIYERTDGMGAEFVFDCAGAQPVIDMLPDAVKINGEIIIVAGYKNPPTMNFQKGMFREFNIRFVRNCTREDFQIAIDLVGKNLGYEKLLNYIIPSEKVAEGFKPPAYAYKTIFNMEV